MRFDAQLRGVPLSQISTERQARPRINAAESLPVRHPQ